MTTRLYLSKTIVELEDLFAASKTDLDTLKRLAQELKHRNVPRAVKLLARVKAAADGTSVGKEPPERNNSGARPYVGKSIIELEALFAAGVAEPGELERLSQELTHRKVPKAVSLLAKVKATAEALASGTAAPKQGASTQKTAAPSNDEPSHKTVPCKVCTQKLRVPLKTGTFSCPSCKAEFKATFEDGVFSLVFAHNAKEKPQTQGPDVAITLDDAYVLFDASEETPWEAVEAKRRKLLQQYHPDKVASLGPKLRALAEVEGKRINVAFALIRQARGY